MIEDERLVKTLAGWIPASDALMSSQHPGGGLLGVERGRPELAEEAVNRVRDAAVLINRTGPKGRLLKIRPPLVYGMEHVELFVRRLRVSLGHE